ncbi:hypothetical protein [Alienimonas sp. DA493]|uniref:hypothetical protein n=1 Tax=Alienimonas sp. DA493 TaxID=3373605 RepID=UPI003753EC82
MALNSPHRPVTLEAVPPGRVALLAEPEGVSPHSRHSIVVDCLFCPPTERPRLERLLRSARCAADAWRSTGEPGDGRSDLGDGCTVELWRGLLPPDIQRYPDVGGPGAAAIADWSPPATRGPC